MARYYAPYRDTGGDTSGDTGGDLQLTPEEQAALKQALAGLGRAPTGNGSDYVDVGETGGGVYGSGTTAAAGRTGTDNKILDDLLEQYAQTKTALDDLDAQIGQAPDVGSRYLLNSQRSTLQATLLKIAGAVNTAKKNGATTGGRPRVYNLGGGRLVAVDDSLRIQAITQGAAKEPTTRQVGRSLLERNPSTGAWSPVYSEPETSTAPKRSLIQKGNQAWWADPTTGSIEPAMTFPDEGPTAVDVWNLDAQRETQRRQDEAAMERQRLSTTASLYGDTAKWWQESVPYAMLPGQQYFLGAEPGGVYSNIARLSGRSFDPNTMRPQPMQPDPLEMYRQAQTLINQQNGRGY